MIEFTMRWTVKRVRALLGGKLIGTKYMQQMVCETLLLLPSDAIRYVGDHVWFISSPEDAWAFTFRGSDIQGKSLIFISDELLQQTREQIHYSILHEVGHVILNHRNSIGVMQSKSEIRHQEETANDFAKQYLG